jgi:hypothetical protein
MKREWKNERRMARGRLPREYNPRRTQPRELREPKGVKRLMTGNVLYLLIVNLPSDEEIAAARSRLAQFQSQHGMMGLHRGPSPQLGDA